MTELEARRLKESNQFLQEEIKRVQEEHSKNKLINTAMENIKNELGSVTKTKTANAGKFSYNYADLNSHLEAVESILKKHGCTLRQPVKCVQGTNVVVSEIVHTESNQSVYSSVGLPEFEDMQKLGAAITYARRYTLSGLLSMKAEDDDAKGAVGNKRTNKRNNRVGDFA